MRSRDSDVTWNLAYVMNVDSCLAKTGLFTATSSLVNPVVASSHTILSP